MKEKLVQFIYKYLSPHYRNNLNGLKQKCEGLRIGSTTSVTGRENLKIGKNVFIGHFNLIDCSHLVVIGDGVQISSYVSILNHSSHDSIRFHKDSYRQQESPLFYLTGTVEIGNYTFIGPSTVIMPNSKIGKMCIVSAYSFVQGEFEDYSIIAGNPAVRIGDTRDRDRALIERNKN